MTNIKSGFTLAEVLITLGIIGVVAAMTIPTLINNSQDRETVSKLKKDYTTLAQAFKLSINDNGSVDTWGLSSNWASQDAINIYNKLSPYLKIIKSCGNSTGCFATNYKLLNGSNISQQSFDSDTGLAKFVLSDGSAVAMGSYGDCTDYNGTSNMLKDLCGEMYIDINGAKSPNIVGRDTFYFYINKDRGIVPASTAVEGSDWEPFDTFCKDKTAADSGWGCTGWVLYNENLDYLKCSNLSWNGPTKCP